MSTDPGALCDTNVLTALRDVRNANHIRVTQAVATLRQRDSLFVAPQSLYEFWVVATRPRPVNGLGWTIQETDADVAALRRLFTVLPDPPGLLDEWLDLCRTHGVSGKVAHDARLAAYARLHGIGALVTLNPRDFKRYGLNVVVP